MPELPEPHLSDQELLLAMDGELAPREMARVEAHFAGCQTCRDRKQELETAAADFRRFERESIDPRIPSHEGPRALLAARIAELADRRAPISWHWAWAAAAVLLIAAIIGAGARSWLHRSAPGLMAVTVPNPNLTPGAMVLLNQREVCSATSVNNKPVPAALRRRVFDEYGLAAAEAKAYEVDYLITPALGGADDIRNLWPQSNSATVWNAQVKDMLEEHLRELVCDGQLDLTTAQREIAANWIEAYKKYFHTDRPLGSDVRAN
jgi:hypothetical protein